MAARARTAAATRSSIAGAWLALSHELDYDEITLDVVAARAGVTVQTVIRHFGSKEELFIAVAREVAAEEEARRAETPIGDVARAVRAVVGHYERIGDIVLRLLGQENRFQAIREMTVEGRRIHYEWVERAFAPFIADLKGAERRRRRAQLVGLTDVYMWKLLRRDLGLSTRQTQAAMAEMVNALVKGT
ncbi:MAG TPA: helix-turn-helix domain-containing protein [Solirubrobacteraceae bacterium]